MLTIKIDIAWQNKKFQVSFWAEKNLNNIGQL